MKFLFAVIFALSAVCALIEAAGSDTKHITFVDFHDDITVFQSYIKADIPIRLLKRIVANRYNQQMKDIYMYAEDAEMDDSRTLNEYHWIERIRVLIFDPKLELIDLETLKPVLVVEVTPFLLVKDLKLRIIDKLGLAGKRIFLYYEQSELQNEETIVGLKLLGGKVMLYSEDA